MENQPIFYCKTKTEDKVTPIGYCSIQVAEKDPDMVWLASTQNQNYILAAFRQYRDVVSAHDQNISWLTQEELFAAIADKSDLVITVVDGSEIHLSKELLFRCKYQSRDILVEPSFCDQDNTFSLLSTDNKEVILQQGSYTLLNERDENVSFSSYTDLQNLKKSKQLRVFSSDKKFLMTLNLGEQVLIFYR